MNALSTIGDYVRRGLFGLIAAIVAVLLAIMVLQIVFRYGFNSSLIWAEEICRYLLIWVSFLACFAAYERGEIAAITMLREALPRRAGLVLAIVCNILGLVLLVVLIDYGLQYAERIGSQPIPALGFLLSDLFGDGVRAPAIYWVYVALPVGMALLAVRLFVDMLRYGAMFATGGYARDLRPLDPDHSPDQSGEAGR